MGSRSRRVAVGVGVLGVVVVAAGLLLARPLAPDSLASTPQPSSSDASPGASAVAPSPRVPGRALFVGDSITVGDSYLGDPVGAEAALGELSWFGSLVAGTGAPVVYAGAVAEVGMTTGWMRANLAPALAGDPDWVIVLGGTNDVASAVPQEDTLNNLRAIIARVQATGARAAIATIPPRDDEAADLETLALNDAIRALGEEIPGLVVLDVGDIVRDPSGGWRAGLTTDGIHPSAQGARLMGLAARSELQDLDG